MVSLQRPLPGGNRYAGNEPSLVGRSVREQGEPLTDTPDDAAILLDDRYGRSRQRGIDRRVGWVLAGAALLTGLAVLLFGGWHTSSTLEFRDLSYEVIDAAHVTVDFEVTAPRGSEVACAVEALSPSFATVGWRILELPTSDQRTRRFSETLVTSYEATTGALRSCWLIQNRA